MAVEDKVVEPVVESLLPGEALIHNEVSLSEKSKVDREKGLILGVHVQGLRRRDDGTEFSLDGIKSQVTRLNQMSIGLNHDYKLGPLTIEDTWGKLVDPYWDEEGAWANLAYNQAHSLTPAILYDVEYLHKFGLSTVVKYNQAKVKGNRVEEFQIVRCDLVVDPATTSGMFNQTTTVKTEEKVAPDMTVQFQQMKTELEELKNTVVKQNQTIQELDLRLRLKVEPEKKLADKIIETESKFDLTKFYWGGK